MKRIYLFMFLSVWMFAACSSNSGTVKTDATPAETPQAVEATPPAPAGDSQPMESTAQAPASEAVTGDAGDNVFYHAGAGISITKPMDWKYLSPEMAVAARQSVKLDDQELEKMIKENPNAPLVVLTRYQEPYPTLNPSVSINMTPMPVQGIPPKDFLNLMLTEGVQKMFPDMTYVDEVQDANIDGINGAYTKVKYTMAAGDMKFPTTTRMWLVPRGKVMFTVGMSGPQEGPDVSEESFQEILKSIKFDK
jgi:hypothetical protein